MGGQDCIIISDDEEDNEPLVLDSVQLLDTVKKKPGVSTFNETICLSDGDESFRPQEDVQAITSSSSESAPSQPVKSQSPSQSQSFGRPNEDDLILDEPYSPPLFSTQSSSSPSPPPTRRTSRSSSKKSDILKRQYSPRDVNAQLPPAKRPSPKISNKSPKMDKLAREELRRQKQKQLQEEKLVKEANRANAGSKALQNCTAILDKNIFKLIKDNEETIFKTLFDESMLTYRVSEYPKVENSVTWSIKHVEVEDGQCVAKFRDADWCLVVMEGQEFFRRIVAYQNDPDDQESIKRYICDIRRRSKTDVILLVYNLNNVLKSERQKHDKNYRQTFKDKFEARNSNNINNNNNTQQETANNQILSINDIEDLRLIMEIKLKQEHPDWKTHIEFYEKAQDIVHTIIRYTCSIARYEVKRKARTSTGLDWAINMDKEKACDPTKSSEDLKKLWITQLQQFSQITLPVAKAIAQEYPSPSALLDQYKSLSKEEGEDLLAELHVQKNLKRQIGKNISRRIFCFMTCDDPNVHIGYS